MQIDRELVRGFVSALPVSALTKSFLSGFFINAIIMLLQLFLDEYQKSNQQNGDNLERME